MKKGICLLLLLVTSLWSSLKAEENVLIACDNGLEMLDWDLEFISHAEHSIELSACFAGGEVFLSMLNGIEKQLALHPALQAYVLMTPVMLDGESKQRIETLLQRYPNNFHVEHAMNVTVFWPDLTAIDNHCKILVVDETYFSCGGSNFVDYLCSEGTTTPVRNPKIPIPFAPEEFPAGARDQDVVGRGPLASQLREAFYELFGIWSHYRSTLSLEVNPEAFKHLYHPLNLDQKPFVSRFESADQLVSLPEGSIQFILGGPHQKNNCITQEYVRLIENAREEIIIANMYFCPLKPIMDALMGAVNRGVRITLITNGVSDVAPAYTKFFCWANRVNYVPIFYGSTFRFWDASYCARLPIKNVQVFEYHVKDILLHKKVMIVDKQYFVIGSYNLGTKSAMSDYELILSSSSKELAREALKVLEKDLRHTREVSAEEARNWYFDPYTSYLGEIQRRFHGLL